MFVATQLPTQLRPSTETALSQPKSSPAIMAALHRFDTLLRRAFLGENLSASSTDSLVATCAVVFSFMGVWLIFLACKLVMGILLLGFSRKRYKGMKEREKMTYDIPGRKTGGFVEVDDEQRKWIFMGDKEGERAAEKKR